MGKKYCWCFFSAMVAAACSLANVNHYNDDDDDKDDENDDEDDNDVHSNISLFHTTTLAYLSSLAIPLPDPVNDDAFIFALNIISLDQDF